MIKIKESPDAKQPAATLNTVAKEELKEVIAEVEDLQTQLRSGNVI